MTVAAAAASTAITLLFWVCCDHGCHGYGCGCGCHGCCRCCGVVAAVGAAAACMYQCLSVYVPLCTYMRVNACACAHLTMFLIPARSHMPHCLCVAETSRMAAFRATDWTKCRHAQRMAALQCSSVALGVAKTLCLITLREIACTNCCHLQHLAALRRPSAT